MKKMPPKTLLIGFLGLAALVAVLGLAAKRTGILGDIAPTVITVETHYE